MDPAVAATSSAYTYGSDSPIDLTDPSGQITITACFGVCLSYDSANGPGFGVGTPGAEISEGNFGVGTKGPGAAAIIYPESDSISASAGFCLGACYSPTWTGSDEVTKVTLDCLSNTQSSLDAEYCNSDDQKYTRDIQRALESDVNSLQDQAAAGLLAHSTQYVQTELCAQAGEQLLELFDLAVKQAQDGTDTAT